MNQSDIMKYIVRKRVRAELVDTESGRVMKIAETPEGIENLYLLHRKLAIESIAKTDAIKSNHVKRQSENNIN